MQHVIAGISTVFKNGSGNVHGNCPGKIPRRRDPGIQKKMPQPMCIGSVTPILTDNIYLMASP